jgi:hypothetical protein
MITTEIWRPAKGNEPESFQHNANGLVSCTSGISASCRDNDCEGWVTTMMKRNLISSAAMAIYSGVEQQDAADVGCQMSSNTNDEKARH